MASPFPAWLVAAGLATCLGASDVEGSAAPRLAASSDGVAVHGLPRAAAERLAAEPDCTGGGGVLTVHTREAQTQELPPMLGRCVLREDGLWFVPRLPFAPGVKYVARFDGATFDSLVGGHGTADAELSFTAPSRSALPAEVISIHPSADALPANLLRVYVRFSAPMLERDVARHLKLLDEEGTELPLPFVEVPQGLWDASSRRLTVFLHPGRIKRGVRPREELGPTLIPGRSYRLVIEPGLRDGAGRPLAAPYVKTFRALEEDRHPPDTGRWSIEAPRAGTLDALRVDLGEPLDQALLLRLVRVEGPSGETVAGEVALSAGESRWSLKPHRPWVAGMYRLVVDPALEDLAGNSLDHRFEEPEGASGSASSAELRLPFAVDRVSDSSR